MEKVIKETVVAEGNDVTQTEVASVETKATGFQTVAYLIYFLFGTLDIFLVTRFILKLFGASTSNSFVGLVYGVSGIFMAPFNGIFHTGISQGFETNSIFEPSTLIAIVVYAFLAWGITKLIQILSGKKQPE